MKRPVFSFLLIFLFSVPMLGQERLTLTGDNHAFSVDIPDGWAVDTSAKAEVQGKRAILYRGDGKHYLDMLDIGLATKQEEGEKAFGNLFEYFIKIRKESNPPVDILDSLELSTDDGLSVRVLVSRSGTGEFALTNGVAFLDGPASVVVMAQLARAPFEDMETTFPELTQVVKSFKHQE